MTEMKNLDKRIAVIGAGPSGITAAKCLMDEGFRDITVFEKNNDVGGNWIYTTDKSHSSVFETTHIISSKKHSGFSDYPMPEDYPDYPSHKQVLQYFRNYTIHFNLYPLIRFQTTVESVTPEGTQWRIITNIADEGLFDGVLVANGHHWDPRMPAYTGEFSGEMIHSHDFKSAAPMKDKRVLVIGGGNSACDCAVETSRVSSYTAISMRRGYYIIPKFMWGKPVDVVNEKFLFLPLALRRPLLKLGWRLEVGKMKDYGLQEPEDPILKSHPVTNSELLYFLRHGKIHPYPDIAGFEGKMVRFTDGRTEGFDVIIACTGYKISFPFLSKDIANFDSTDVPLWLKTFYPVYPGLYFIGLVQPQGCIWPLSEAQSKLVSAHLSGRFKLPKDVKERVRRETERTRSGFLNTPRHTVEVHYHEYMGELRGVFRG
jgi:hypothetical protein